MSDSVHIFLVNRVHELLPWKLPVARARLDQSKGFRTPSLKGRRG